MVIKLRFFISSYAMSSSHDINQQSEIKTQKGNIHSCTMNHTDSEALDQLINLQNQRE